MHREAVAAAAVEGGWGYCHNAIARAPSFCSALTHPPPLVCGLWRPYAHASAIELPCIFVTTFRDSGRLLSHQNTQRPGQGLT